MVTIAKTLNHAIKFLLFFLIFYVPFGLNAAWDFTPRIQASQTYTDNVRLDSSNEESEHITQVNPGFSLTNLGSRYATSIEYKMENLFYWDESDANDTFHQLDAVGDFEVLKNRLFIDTNVNSSQSLIDPEQTFSTRNIQTTGNTTDEFTWRVSPYWVEELGSFSIATFRFGYIENYIDKERADFSTVDTQDDSTTTQYVVKFENFSPDDQLTWELGYRKDKVNFDSNPTVELQRYILELGWKLSRNITLLGLGGYEKNDFVTTLDDSNDIDDNFWEAGFLYQVSPKNQLEARYGERFFGNTRFFSWDFEGRRLNLTARYREELTTDVIDQEFRSVDEEPSLADDVQTDIGRRDFEVFESDRFDLMVAYELPKSSFSLNFFDDDRTFQVSRLEDKSRGAEFNWDWRFKPKTTFIMNLFWEQEEFQENINMADRKDDNYDVSLGLEFQLSPRLFFNTNYIYTERTSDMDTNEYDANTVTAGFTYELN